MPLDPTFVRAIVRYREVSDFMSDFLSSMRSNPRKDTAYSDDVLRALLAEADVSVQE